jgi:hypothetical protein
VTDHFWTNSAGGDWNNYTPLNWSTGTVPTSSDNVIFTLPGNYTVTIGGGVEVKALYVEAPGARLIENEYSLTIGGARSGTGLAVSAGFVSLNQPNVIANGVTVSGGELAFGNAGALGSGFVFITGGELLATTNETFSNTLVFTGGTIAAAPGTILNEDATTYDLDGLNIGSPGEDGTILWHSGRYEFSNFPVDVQAGTLKAADDGFSSLTRFSTKVDAGATLDVAGFDTTIGNLTGGGNIIDSGGPATLTLDGANFSGSISGPLSVDLGGAASLSGLEDIRGTRRSRGRRA